MSATAPIMLRANITADEWATLRKLALDRRTSAASLVADALRAAYPLTPKEQSE
jgi:hypothetical protein